MKNLASLSDMDMPSRKSRWIPWTFVAGFGVVVAVNAVLIVFAMTSWSGLETEQAYQKGLAYNETLAAATEQEARGWTTTLSFTPDGALSGALAFTLMDEGGEPILGAEVVARIVRPTVTGYDQTVVLESQGKGRYAARLDLPMAGQWQVDLEAVGKGLPYKRSERILVR